MRPCNNLINTPPTLGSKGSEKTTEGRHPLGFLLSGPGAILSGRQSPPGGPDSASRFPRRYTIPFIALLAALTLGLLFLLPGGLLQAQDNGPIMYAENGMGPVATYTAVDPEGADIVWSVTGADDAGDFSIENGTLMFKSPPDYERQVDGQAKTTYTVTVSASDGGTMMDTEEVTVNVTNVDEPGLITLSSLQPQAGILLTATLTDPDGAASGTKLQWEKSTSAEGPWTAIEDEIALTYTPANTDAGDYLRITAEYKDPESTENTKMAQAVSANPVRSGSAVGNEPPEFRDESDMAITSAVRMVRENTPAGQPVGDPVTATEEDADDILTYTLGGNDGDSFAIDVTNGQVMTKAALNAEAVGGDNYTVTVTATDPFEAMDVITVTITVEDVNEPPTVSGAASIEHPEGGTVLDTDLTNGADAATYDETDPDDGATATWSVSGADRGKFEIDTTGLLAFKAAPDYEMPGDANSDNVYEIMVVATDNEGETGMMSVTVKVTNINEDGNVALSSVQPRVVVAMTATLTDPDGSVSGVAWQWSRSQTAQGIFDDIEDATSATYTPVAGDADPDRYYLKATASYTDGEGSDKRAEMVSVNPVLADTTNKAPYFPDTDPDTEGMQDEGRERSVAENTVAGAADDVVGEPVTAMDPNGDSLTYTLGGADAGLFTVDQDDITTTNADENEGGQIRVRDGTELDKETEDTYMVSVTATDSYGLSATTMVTIMVTNVDEAPNLTGEATAEYAENGTGPVATYTAVDPEGADIVWSVTVVDAADFSIENGVLMFKSPPDYERQVGNQPKTTYTVTIEASDGGGESDTIEVTVSVTNVDEPGTITLSSLQPQAGIVLTATLTDPDGATSGTERQWERSRRTSGPWVAIEDENAFTYTPLNTDAGYYLRITAEYKDPESTENTKMARVVSANMAQARSDVGNIAPEFRDDEDVAITSVARTVRENTSAGQPVGDPVTATDDDSGDILTYTLEGTDANSFAIDVTNGQLMTKAALNEEAKDSYSVDVTATDPFDESDEIAVTITVEDVNEPPTVTGTGSIEHPENDTVLDIDLENQNANPANYTAADPENGTTTWSVLGADAGKFAIDEDNDLLSFMAAPNYEMPGDANSDNVYEIMVVATDDGGEAGMMSVTVKVTNINEDGNVALSSVQPRVVVAMTATLTDPDGSVSGVAWQWSRSQTAQGIFDDIEDATSATYTPVAGDADPDRYYLKATASYTDGEGSDKRAEMVSVNPVLADTTNKAPYFPDTDPDTEGMQDEGRERSVAENTVAGAADDVVGEPVTAMDPNGDSLTYTLGGADAGLFKVDQDDIATDENEGGQIRVGAGTMLDKESRDTYMVTVTATDSYGLSATTMVTIMVTDMDEAPEIMRVPEVNVAPEFASATTSRTVAENTAAGEDIGNPVAANDANGDTLAYALGGANAASFTIDSATGQLMTLTALDYETKASYSVTVTATDPDDETATIEVTITVTNVDEMGTLVLSSTTPSFDAELTATLTDLDGMVSGETWMWYKSMDMTFMDGNETVIANATSMSYTPVADDAGYYLMVKVMYTDGHGPRKEGMATTSNMVVAGDPVAGDPLLIRYDANNNDKIDIAEVYAAIDDYFNNLFEPTSGGLTKEQVYKIIDLYFDALLGS